MDSDQLGPEPDLLPENTQKGTETPDLKTEKYKLKPNVTAFSCTLLLWVITFIIFFVAYLALSKGGLWCPAPPNNATISRTGTMIRYISLALLEVDSL